MWSYEADGVDPATPGAVSVLLDGDDRAACVVEMVEVECVPFCEIGSGFAVAYGEWGVSLEEWHAGAWAYCSAVCNQLGRQPAADMPLVCERFRLLHAFDQPCDGRRSGRTTPSHHATGPRPTAGRPAVGDVADKEVWLGRTTIVQRDLDPPAPTGVDERIVNSADSAV